MRLLLESGATVSAACGAWTHDSLVRAAVDGEQSEGWARAASPADVASRAAIVELLLSHGAALITPRSSVEGSRVVGTTALLAAARRGMGQTALAILRSISDPSERSAYARVLSHTGETAEQELARAVGRGEGGGGDGGPLAQHPASDDVRDLGELMRALNVNATGPAATEATPPVPAPRPPKPNRVG